VRAGARIPAGARLAAVGEGTSEVLREGGLAPHLVAPVPSAAALADAIIEAGRQRSILFLRGRRARRELPERLAAAGREVEELEVYTTEDAPFDAALLSQMIRGGRIAASVVTSPSAAEAIRGRLAPREWKRWLDTSIVVPGETTGAALGAHGASRVVVARTPLEDGLAEALLTLPALAGKEEWR
jgi:uroporphyrinogen-III synthase